MGNRKLVKSIYSQDELESYEEFKEQLVYAVYKKNPVFDYEIKIFTNYKTEFEYRYIDKKLISVKVFELEQENE